MSKIIVEIECCNDSFLNSEFIKEALMGRTSNEIQFNAKIIEQNEIPLTINSIEKILRKYALRCDSQKGVPLVGLADTLKDIINDPDPITGNDKELKKQYVTPLKI